MKRNDWQWCLRAATVGVGFKRNVRYFIYVVYYQTLINQTDFGDKAIAPW